MAVTIATDKIAIQAILSTDSYIVDYLGFSPNEIYRVKATDDILKDGKEQQIFIFNADPERTINPIIHRVVYEVDVSVPWAKSGTADLAIEQIMALLTGTEIANTHRLEILDMPTVLPSETALYQVGVRFACYETIYTKVKTYTPPPEEDEGEEESEE